MAVEEIVQDIRKAQGLSGVGSRDQLKRRIAISLIAAICGLAAFLAVYGVTPLDVTNDLWIMAGYDESDIIQHYAGWLAFRNSGWTFPLGIAGDMAVGDGGVCISFTDSIPWVSIFFKLIRSILPETFQFFGIYALLCYILQSIAAVNILYEACDNIPYAVVGTILFSFSPIMMERSMRHTALGSHWLILFAIFVCIRNRHRQTYLTYVWYLLLLVLAIGIHPYFLPMIAAFMLISVIDDAKSRKGLSVVLLFADMAVTYGAGCLIGVLGNGVQVSRSGYGYFSMNLNAVVNPTSLGPYNWSAFLKVHPQILGNYDGFNYLGFGMIVALLWLGLLCVIYGKGRSVLTWMRRNWYVIMVLLCCTLFAVSNVVTFHDRIILNIPLPEFLLSLCGIFRASSRIFYPVYYCIFISMIVGLWRCRTEIGVRKVTMLLTMLVGLQILDLSGVITQKHQAMEANAACDSLLTDESIDMIFSGKESLLLDTTEGNKRYPAVAALKHGVNLYFSIANSGSYYACYILADELLNQIRQTGEIGSYVIATDNPETAQTYLGFDQISCYERGGVYYLSGTELLPGEHSLQDAEYENLYHYCAEETAAAE